MDHAAWKNHPIHLHGKSAIFSNGEAMELPAQGCRITAPDKLLNLWGIWQWRLDVFYTLNVNSLGQELNY